MAADTKRGATIKGLQFHAMHYGLGVDVDDLKSLLAAQGLHVVTAADKAVLDAMGRIDEMQLQMVAEADEDGMWTMAAVAELARRGLR